MGEPFLSEIRMVGFNFAPRGWALCNGEVLPVNQNQALYALIGNMYGGSPSSTFALPDLRGRVPVGIGQLQDVYPQGRVGGVESVVLQQQNMPQHNHVLQASSDDATEASPENMVLATPAAGRNVYGEATSGNLVSLGMMSIGTSGGAPPGGQTEAHNNIQPTQVINFCIATSGIFPSRN